MSLATTEVRNGTDGRFFANKKFHQEDFSGRDLSNADFRGAQLLECNFNDSNLTGANFTDANCWGSSFIKSKLYKANFTRACLAKCTMDGADCYGMTITLSCDSFEDLTLSDKWVSAWLYFVLMMNVPESLKMKLTEIIGEERVKKYDAVLRRRDI